jgi:hypothetical protein
VAAFLFFDVCVFLFFSLSFLSRSHALSPFVCEYIITFTVIEEAFERVLCRCSLIRRFLVRMKIFFSLVVVGQKKRLFFFPNFERKPPHEKKKERHSKSTK